MNWVKGEYDGKKVTIHLSGRIDSNNAKEGEEEIRALLNGKGRVPVVLDLEDLDYISSAGLRVLLHLKKSNPDLKLINVNSGIYEILEMTGFTQMMDVEKAYRVVSVDGCEVIGRGANGTIYRIDHDNVVKVYNNADALSEIQNEREVARKALILGIPTAISYDVVRVGDSYGSVFELLDAESFSKILIEKPEKMDWCVREFVKMLKKIHSTEVPEGELPDMKALVLSWVGFLKDYLPKETADKLYRLVSDVPQDNHMLHGDYHTKNLELQGDEVLLIDMDTLAVGHPIFELAFIYNSYIGYSEIDHNNIYRFQGFSFEMAKLFWHKMLGAYLGTDDEDKIREVEDKARLVGYIRLLRRSIRRGLDSTETGLADYRHWKEELIDLVAKTDTLLFSVNELDIEAVRENLSEVLAFVDKRLEDADCPMKAQMQIDLAVEEIFINIASYAYAPDKGRAKIRAEVSGNPITVTLTFIDHGIPYDPLAKADPDVTLSAEERGIGGLGIFMVKKTMDDVSYEYKDGSNILTLKKSL